MSWAVHMAAFAFLIPLRVCQSMVALVLGLLAFQGISSLCASVVCDMNVD